MSYHIRTKYWILIDKVHECEGHGEAAEEDVGEGEVGDEDVPGGDKNLHIKLLSIENGDDKFSDLVGDKSKKNGDIASQTNNDKQAVGKENTVTRQPVSSEN